MSAHCAGAWQNPASFKAQTLNRQLTVAAAQIAAMKLTAFRSYRVASAEHAFDGVAIAIEERRKAFFHFRLALGGMFGIALSLWQSSGLNPFDRFFGAKFDILMPRWHSTVSSSAGERS
jgi:hypothetical protein